MHKQLLLLALIIMCGVLPHRAAAQTDALMPTNLPADIQSDYPEYATAFRVDVDKLSDLRAMPVGQPFSLTLDLPILGSSELTLERFDVLTHDVQMLGAGEDGEFRFHVETPVFLSGEIAGASNSFVYLMLNSTSCEGIIEFRPPGSTTPESFHVNSVRSADGENPLSVIIQREDEDGYVPTEVSSCGHDHSGHGHDEEGEEQELPLGDPVRQFSGKGNTDRLLNWPMLEARIAMECNWYLFENSGDQENNIPPSIQRTANRALFLLGGASAIYRRDIRTNLKLCYLRVWVEEPEVNTVPYRAIFPDNDEPGIDRWPTEGPACRYRRNMLPIVSTNWEQTMGHVQRSCVVWLNGLGCGGIATDIGDLCEEGPTPLASTNVTGAAFVDDHRDVRNLAHELGHNFDSPHTNAYWPRIDNCLNNPQPHPTGTIMSGCNPQELRFHARAKDRMRAHAENAACVYPDPNGTVTSRDASVEAILLPQAGATLYNGDNGTPGTFAPFAPQASIRNIGAEQILGLQVQCAIIPFGGEFDDNVWDDTQTITTLNSNTTETVTFAAPPTATIPEIALEYQMMIRIAEGQDDLNFNDQVIHHFTVTDDAPTDIVTLNGPNGGQFYAGSIETISVAAPEGSRVLIEFSSDDGDNWEPVSERLVPQSEVINHDWEVPAVATAQGRVRVSLRDNAAAPDLSDQAFTILLPHDLEVFDIVDPSGQAVESPAIPRVQIQNNGNTTHFLVPVLLEIKRVAPLGLSGEREVYKEIRILPQLNPGQLASVFFPEAFMHSQDQYFAKATLLGTNDMTPENNSLERVFRVTALENDFQITTPRGNDILQVGSETQIEWVQLDGVETDDVQLEWSNDGETWELIREVPNIGMLEVNQLWQVPNIPSDNSMRIRISNGQDASSISEYFSTQLIQPPTALTSQQRVNASAPRIRLNWTPSTSDDLTGYEIYRSVNGGTFSFLQTINDENIDTFDDDNVALCSDYRYQLRSFFNTENGQTILSNFGAQTEQKAIPAVHLPNPPQLNGSTDEAGGEPYGKRFSRSERLQFLIFANDLTAQGFTADNDISSLAFDAFAAHNTTLNNYQIRIRQTNATNMTQNFEENLLTTVFGPADFTPQNGWNVHSFSQLFNWDGNQNLLIDICWTTQAALTAHNHTEKEQSPNANDFWSLRHAEAGTGACAAQTGTTSRFRPRIVLQADRAPLEVTSPNGGESWKIGRLTEVTWDAGCFQNENLIVDFSVNSGVAWTPISGEIPNTGSFIWEVPDNPISTARIRVRSAAEEIVNDFSDADFTIEAQNANITITAPTGASQWQVGGMSDITWTSTGTGDDAVNRVDILYSDDDGANWEIIVQDVFNSGLYTWQVPNTPSVEALVRVRDSDNPSQIIGTSNLFEIVGLGRPTALQLTPDPNNIEMDLTWSPPAGGTVTGYSILRGANANNLSTIDVIANTTSYSDISAVACVDYTYAVRAIASGIVSENSDTQTDRIVPAGTQVLEISSPDGGENLTIGTNWEITWNVCGPQFTHARLEYSTDGGNNWILIDDQVDNTGSFLWEIPMTPTSDALVRVLNDANHSMLDVSDATFFIKPPADMLLAAGQRYSLVVKPSSGNIWSWGDNGSSQLGDGTGIDRIVPGEVLNLPEFAAIDAGGQHTMALTHDGRVFTWGHNLWGQIGINKISFRVAIPFEVPGLPEIVQIAAGQSNCYALAADGTIWSWGLNLYGAVGDGTTTGRYAPVLLAGIDNVIQITAGVNTAYALRADGTVWAWGDNEDQLLGTGSTALFVSTPELMPNLANIVFIEGGGSGGAAIASNGNVWGWGDNSSGQVGDGLMIDRTTPVLLPVLAGAAQISRGREHGLALMHDGELWVWGSNEFGQLGNGSLIDSPQPIENANVANVQRVAAGYTFSLVYRLDGQVCTWGNNEFGQLGNNSTINSSLPVCLTQSFLRDGENDHNANEPVIHAQWDMKLYPNPNNGQFNVSIANADADRLQVVVMDILGREVLTIERRNVSGALDVPLDLRGRTPGVYLVKVVRDQNTSSTSYVTVR